MSTGTLMTMEEFLALPDDGVERWLIRGELRERAAAWRTPAQGRLIVQLGSLLLNWRDGKPEPRGRVVGGKAGFRLRDDPPTIVGIDVAYVSAELSAATPKGANLFEGAPVLAVEVLSPSSREEQVVEKVREYLDRGVELVWVVDPALETVMLYRPNAKPESFNSEQELDGEPHLPVFRVPVARLFEYAQKSEPQRHRVPSAAYGRNQRRKARPLGVG